MFHIPMSSPMMTTMFGRCPAVAGVGAGCCACAGLVNPTAESAEAATRELPLNKRSRRFNPPPIGPVLISGFSGILSLLMIDPLIFVFPELKNKVGRSPTFEQAILRETFLLGR